MARDLSLCANIFRVLFIIFNVIYILLGLLGLASGAYSLSQSDNASFLTGSDVISGAAIQIVVSIIVIAIGILGVVGAIFRLRPLLLVYAIIWSVLLVLQVIGAIISFYYSSTVSAAAQEGYADGWQRAIEQYNTSNSARQVVDGFQNGADCCGYNNYTDWIEYNPYYFRNNSFRLPSSCRCTRGDNCANITVEYLGMRYPQFAYNRGCLDATVDYFQFLSFLSGIGAIVFTVIELFGVAVAIGLICCITKAKEKEYV